MYVNYCISLEVISWSWISAEHQVESFLLPNQSIGSRFLRSLYDETHINSFFAICLATILNKDSMTCTVVGLERSAHCNTVKPALMTLTCLYQQGAVQDFVCVCVNNAELCH